MGMAIGVKSELASLSTQVQHHSPKSKMLTDHNIASQDDRNTVMWLVSIEVRMKWLLMLFLRN